MGRAPDEDVHTAHRRAEDQAQPIDLEPFDQHPPLRLDHVGIAIFRERRPQSVAGFGRGPVAQIVRHDDEILGRIQRLARPEQLAGELRRQELRPGAARAMQQQDRIGHPARRVASPAGRASGSASSGRGSSSPRDVWKAPRSTVPSTGL